MMRCQLVLAISYKMNMGKNSFLVWDVPRNYFGRIDWIFPILAARLVLAISFKMNMGKNSFLVWDVPKNYFGRTD